MGHAASAFFDTQIGGRQSVHLCWTDGTFGFGVSATREQTTYILSSMAYDIGGLQRAGRFNAANVTVDDNLPWNKLPKLWPEITRPNRFSRVNQNLQSLAPAGGL